MAPKVLLERQDGARGYLTLVGIAKRGSRLDWIMLIVMSLSLRVKILESDNPNGSDTTPERSLASVRGRERCEETGHDRDVGSSRRRSQSR